MSHVTSPGVIHIIGLGVAERAELDSHARSALRAADVVIGAPRQLATVAHLLDSATATQVELPALAQLAAVLKRYEQCVIAVLASGDPLFYGIGRWFAQQITTTPLCFHPAVSSVQATCHRLGVALQDIEVVSLHGRPVGTIRRKLRRNRQLLVLTDQHSQPQQLAQSCVAAGFGESTITVFERLGYSDEKMTSWSVARLADSGQEFDPLHVTHLQLAGSGGVLPEFPGIPDHHFETGEVSGKGMISKREVRLAILSLMQVAAGDVVWDIGAGCGGVAVELALWQEQAVIHAVEDNRERVGYLRQNQQRFGVEQNLHIVFGRAPAALADLPDPDKVFIGGSGGELEYLLRCIWRKLPTAGLLVVSTVTERSSEHVQAFAQQLLPEQVVSVQLQVQRGHVAGGAVRYTPKLPVTLFQFTRAAGER